MIRAATEADVPEILAMIRELAEYEREPDAAQATAEQLHDALFGEHPAVFAHVAVDGAGADGAGADGAGADGAGADGAGADGAVVGMALWFRNFSTWTGTFGVYLEDLYVRPHARGGGHGKGLLATLAAVCVERGYRRCEWSVLDWNAPAIGFYRSIGAVGQDEWTVQRLTGDALEALAAQAPNGVAR
ncbi:GNAT family N-acetyltransferase [Tsukamurella soli]|uniref:GNAT family N-acetyltransferase n=1 Tax=Tsukamurella soli TaxID=644556 RepID=A0ABP8KA44_9ACTN